MKLIGILTPYSSIVGGGIALLDEKGRTKFLINLLGTTEGINKEQNDILSVQICTLINEYGLEL